MHASRIYSYGILLLLAAATARPTPIIDWETDDSSGVTLRISDWLTPAKIGPFDGGFVPAFDLTSPSGLWRFTNVRYNVDYRPALDVYGLNTGYGMTGYYIGSPPFRFFTHGGITFGSKEPDFTFGSEFSNFQPFPGNAAIGDWAGEYIYHFIGEDSSDFSKWRYEIFITVGPAVPDSASTLILVGFAICGIAAIRRTKLI